MPQSTIKADQPHSIPAPRTSTHCGLKACATLAWGKAPGSHPDTSRGLKVRAKSHSQYKTPTADNSCNRQTSIPHILLIERNTILGKHGPHLRSKITPLMMHGLPVDITHQRGPIAQSNGERSIPALPSKLSELWPLRLDPLRRRNLQPLYQTRYGLGSSKKHRQMHVIRNPTNTHTNILRTVEDRGEVRVHLRTDDVVEQWPTVFRAEDKMNQHIGKRLGHGRQYSAGLQPANHTCWDTWGDAPGYGRSGLQPSVIEPSALPSTLFHERP